MKRIDQKIISAGEYSPRFNPGTPFLVEGCMILLCTTGNASFSLNFQKYDIYPGDIVFLFNDMVIELGDRSDDFALQYVTITNERTFEIYVSITSQKFWDKLYLSPIQRFKTIYHGPFSNWIKQSIFVYDYCRKDISDKVISNMVISLFLVMEDIIGHSAEEISPMLNNSPWKIVGDFFVLLSRHYMSQHKVKFYADKLNITSDYLSLVIKDCTGVSPKETIDGKLVLAMKSLLESSSLSIKNISDRLHYEDSSHLCKVFRRHTGMSPVEYRKSLIK